MVRRVQYLIVEDGVVEGKSESDGVGALEVFSFLGGYLIGVLGHLNDCFAPNRVKETTYFSAEKNSPR